MNFSDFSGSIKHAAKERAITYAKSYHLLHRQLVQKKRANFAKDVTIYVDDKPYSVLLSYDIKSWSKEPYRPWSQNEPNVWNLGLNQLFVGQNPYKSYEGDPKDGIYHDECMIYPKVHKSVSFSEYQKKSEKEKGKFVPYTDNYGWVLSDYEIQIAHLSFVNIETKLYFYKSDAFGRPLCQNVEYVNEFSSSLNGKNIIKHKYKITYTDKVEYIDITPLCISFDGTNITQGLSVLEYVNLTKKEITPPVLDLNNIISRYGEITHFSQVTEESASLPSIYELPKGVISLAKAKRDFKTQRIEPEDFGKVHSAYIVFRNNVVLKVRGGFKYKGFYIAPQVAQLTLCDSSGELLMSRFAFVEKWDDYFYLHVYEKKHWYHKLMKALILIVIVALSVYLPYLGYSALGLTSASLVSVFGVVTSVGNLLILGGFFTALSVVGSFGNNNAIKLIGTIGGLIISIANITTQSAIKKAQTESINKVTGKFVDESKKLLITKVTELFNSPWIKGLVATANAVYSTISSFKSEKNTDEIRKKEKRAVKVENEEQILQPNFIQQIIDIKTLNAKVMDLDSPARGY